MLSGLRWPGQTVMGSWPPANVRRLEQKKFYICSDVTHTHETAISTLQDLASNVFQEFHVDFSGVSRWINGGQG